LAAASSTELDQEPGGEARPGDASDEEAQHREFDEAESFNRWRTGTGGPFVYDGLIVLLDAFRHLVCHEIAFLLWFC